MQDRIEGVQAALELLSTEVAKLLETVRSEGAEAYERDDMAAFERLRRQKEDITGFSAQVEALAKEWRALAKKYQPRALGSSSPRPRPGEVTPEKEYVLPILQALHEAGGAAPASAVIRRVGEIMAGRFTEKDRELLNRGEVRWIHRTRWVRHHAAAGGLLASDSPKGVWQITPAGEALLRSGDVDSIWPKLREARRAQRSSG